ncbi:MAG: hypothetical protein ICV67_00715 [Thermoleophilia bacterium]|nr:hypothetical protein [Thermoleophilia bacterium]
MLTGAILASAAAPALVLARLVSGRWWAAALAAAACVAVPWIRLGELGPREAAAYAAFVLALLALYRAVAAPSSVNDAVALGAIALASLAHGQLVLLLAALPAALFLREGVEAFPRHRLLAAVYAVLVGVAFLALAGVVDQALGWKWRIVRESVQTAVVRATVEHAASLAWSLAVVPLLVAVGWLLARGRRDAFAALGLAVLALVLLAASGMDVLFAGGQVRERYLVYAVPVVAVALAGAVAPLHRPRWSAPAAVLAWLGLGLGLSRVTGRINDWFVMTDELFYERLAISVARTGSPLPRVRGELIDSFNQLYPVLIAPAYARGLVPDSLHEAHVLNAFLMTSTLVPAYLLTRSVTGRADLALGVGVLAVVVPWLTLSSFLLTEVAAYPAFAWAVYALYRAAAFPRPLNDALTLAGIALAAVARVQFLVLLAVLPVALLLHDGRHALARHRLLAAAYAAMALGAVALAATGEVARVLGTYGQTAQGAFPPGLPRAFLEHAAAGLALPLAILPFLVAAAWLLAALARPGDGRQHAFASVALVTVVVVLLQVASFDERFGGRMVRDRYLFYLVPVLLAALACALVAPRWPPWWSLAAPTAVVIAGFALYELPRFERLSVDSPVAVVHDRLLDLGGSVGGAQAGLVLLTVVLVLLFVQGAALLPRAAVAAVIAGLAAAALPAQAGSGFSRLFALPGTSGRALTHDQAGVFNWVDRAVGPDADATMVPYPHLSGDYWATVAFWWDLEFWNKSVVRAAYLEEAFSATPPTFAHVAVAWDERGRLASSPTRYVAQFSRDVRFRIAGEVVWNERETQLIDAGEEWRLAWATSGLYEDGWTSPDTEVRVTVFPEQGQDGPLTRLVSLVLRPPGQDRGARLSSGLGEASATLRDETGVLQVPVCVRPGAPGEALLRVEGAGPIEGNPVNAEIFSRPRLGGVQVRELSVAGESRAGC